jgi:hypothetical protein
LNTETGPSSRDSRIPGRCRAACRKPVGASARCGSQLFSRARHANRCPGHLPRLNGLSVLIRVTRRELLVEGTTRPGRLRTVGRSGGEFQRNHGRWWHNFDAGTRGTNLPPQLRRSHWPPRNRTFRRS